MYVWFPLPEPTLFTDVEQAINSHPALLKQTVPAMNVVGAVDNDGKIWAKSNTANYVNIYAPGVDLRLVGRDGKDNNDGKGYSGTSYCKPGPIVPFNVGLSANIHFFKLALESLQLLLISITKRTRQTRSTKRSSTYPGPALTANQMFFTMVWMVDENRV